MTRPRKNPNDKRKWPPTYKLRARYAGAAPDPCATTDEEASGDEGVAPQQAEEPQLLPESPPLPESQPDQDPQEDLSDVEVEARAERFPVHWDELPEDDEVDLAFPRDDSEPVDVEDVLIEEEDSDDDTPDEFLGLRAFEVMFLTVTRRHVISKAACMEIWDMMRDFLSKAAPHLQFRSYRSIDRRLMTNLRIPVHMDVKVLNRETGNYILQSIFKF